MGILLENETGMSTLPQDAGGTDRLAHPPAQLRALVAVEARGATHPTPRDICGHCVQFDARTSSSIFPRTGCKR